VSFHSTLIATAAWPTDLVSAGVIGATAAAYAGTTRQHVSRAGVEALMKRLDVTEHGRGFQGLHVHPYALELRLLHNTGGKQNNDESLTTLEAHVRTLVERYHGKRPMVATLTDLVTVEAFEGPIEVDPENEKVLTGTVRINWLVKQ
jgi:hypothetical protein